MIVYSDCLMPCVTLTFDVWIQVKVTAHRLNEDNICTKFVTLSVKGGILY